MFKVEIWTLEGCFAADPGSKADLRAGARQAGTAGGRRAGAGCDGRIRPVIRTGERGAL